MKVEVKDVLNDIKVMIASVGRVYFVSNEDSKVMFPAMPAINRWNAGTVRMELRSESNVQKMIEVLARYGHVAKANIVNGNQHIITFQCTAADDIIQIISQVLTMQRLQLKSNQLDVLNQEVEQVAQQVPYVQSSMFSRGVKNLRNGVETLNNIVVSQKKERRR